MTLPEQDAPDHWPQLIRQWQDSGLSGKQFCRDHDLVYHCFIYWRKKHRRQSPVVPPQPAGPSGFVKVARQSSPARDDRLTLSLPGGLALSGITAGNVGLLRPILEQL
jgi:hypothetical protein